ncbi:hypothetical protein GQ44DRAFT_717108 [Phaeosphaeriaceae sp. PMI808]|nr:hypothetical protein GQ44DRAFT_717108 [Phaeosphaeriaceae sp. PMI808]
MSEQEDNEEMHHKDMQDVNTGITLKKILQPSPKTRMIEIMERERGTAKSFRPNRRLL